MCPSFDYNYFPACPNIVAGWKAKKYQQLRSTDKKGPVIVITLLLMQAGDINPNPGPNNTDLAVCIGKYNPDIIIGTETHLDSSVNSSELFPSNYSVIRKDRNLDNSKGGVLIAMKDDLIGTHRTDLDTKCEIVWVTITIQG